MNVGQLQSFIDRLSLVSWQRWALSAMAMVAAAGASTVTAMAAGRQTDVILVLVVGIAVAAVVRPDSHTAAVVEVIVVWQWLASTDGPMTAWVVALALCLFVFHTVIALMAVTPIGAVVDRSVLLRWLRRSGWVVLATVAMYALVVVMNERRAAGRVELTALGFVTLTVLILVMRSSGRSPEHADR